MIKYQETDAIRLRKYPFQGHLTSFLSDKLGFLMAAAKKYGEVAPLSIGGKTFLLNNAEDIKHVLVTNSRNYEKTPRLTGSRGRKIYGKGLLTTFNSEHLQQRRMLQPAFHQEAILKFVDDTIEVTNQKTADWKNGQRINISDEMLDLAQQVNLKALFGKDQKGYEKELAEAVTTRRAFNFYLFSSLFPFPEYLPNRINLRHRKAIRFIDDFIYKAIKKRRKEDIPSVDLLTMIMRQPYKDGSVMNDRQVRDEAITLLITGYETIGEALTWSLYNLSQHPTILGKLEEELSTVLKGNLPTIKDLPNLTYTEMVISESMRIFPPTWIFVRIASQQDELPRGTKIPPGSKIYLCPYVVHRNPKYFPNPEKFEPERFLPEIQKNRPKYAYFPFGGGPRLCIGKPFAKMEYTLVLAMIASKYKFSLLPDQEVILDPGITLTPKNGLWFEVESNNL